MNLSIEGIARVCHEANKAYCHGIDDDSQLHWDDAPQWQRDSAINGVKFHFQNPDATPQSSHENWLKEKIESGWTYGDTKDVENKKHPCIAPYNELPIAQRVKDLLFKAVIDAITTGKV